MSGPDGGEPSISSGLSAGGSRHSYSRFLFRYNIFLAYREFHLSSVADNRRVAERGQLEEAGRGVLLGDCDGCQGGDCQGWSHHYKSAGQTSLPFSSSLTYIASPFSDQRDRILHSASSSAFDWARQRKSHPQSRCFEVSSLFFI